MKFPDTFNAYSALVEARKYALNPELAPIPEKGGTITYALTKVAYELYHRTAGFLDSVENSWPSKHADFNDAISIRTENNHHLVYILAHASMKFTKKMNYVLVHLVLYAVEREIEAINKLVHYEMVENMFRDSESNSTHVYVAESPRSNDSGVYLAY